MGPSDTSGGGLQIPPNAPISGEQWYLRENLYRNHRKRKVAFFRSVLCWHRYNLQLWGSIARRIQGQLPCHVESLLGVVPQRFIARCDGQGLPNKINKFSPRVHLYFFFRPFVWAEIDALYGEQERMSSACSALWRSHSSKEV